MMSYLINNQQNLNEVIFANRNKSYGAYAIRSAYGNTMFKSLFIMTVGFGTIMSLAFYFSNRNNTPEESGQTIIQDSTQITVFDIKPEEPVEVNPQPERRTPPVSNTTPPENTVVNINDTLSVHTHSALNTDPNQHVTSTNTSSSTTTGGPETTTGGGGTTGSATSSTTGKPTELVFVDTPPEFEGGLGALYKFVSKNVRYPEDAYNKGKEGTIYVKFVVDEKGKVGQLSLLNNVGFGFDEEALRVVGMIPNFKSPAKVKGDAVKVYYQLPIKFRYN